MGSTNSRSSTSVSTLHPLSSSAASAAGVSQQQLVLRQQQQQERHLQVRQHLTEVQGVLHQVQDRTLQVLDQFGLGRGPPRFPRQQAVLQGPFRCSRCGHHEHSQGETRETEGLLSKVLNIQSRRFVTVSCHRCGLTDFYEKPSALLGNILDLLFR